MGEGGEGVKPGQNNDSAPRTGAPALRDRPQLTSPDEQRRIGRRAFLRYHLPAYTIGGAAAFGWLKGWWKLPWEKKEEPGLTSDAAETNTPKETRLNTGQMTDLFGQVNSYLKEGYGGEFVQSTINTEKIDKFAKSIPAKFTNVEKDEFETGIPKGATIYEMDLKALMPKFADIRGAMVYRANGSLAKTIFKGHFEKSEIPDRSGDDELDLDVLAGIVDKAFKTKARTFVKSQQSGEVLTDDSKALGMDANNMPKLPELQLNEYSKHAAGIDNMATLAANLKGGWILDINSPEPEVVDQFPDAKG